MKTPLVLLTLASLLVPGSAEPEFPLTADSQAQPSVPKGEMLKGSYVAAPGSLFPGTVRDYQIYLPVGVDRSKPLPFMVFQDGVIYQAPVVFDNLIARQEIPALAGIFVRPGVVPAAREDALPRFNRSLEYDSVTADYATFLIDELLPALEKAHGITLSQDPNQAAIAGNSSGGIAAFMVAWHRPDRFRRVFTGVGTYVGIRGADALPVFIRKVEPKPLRVFLQSGTGDNDLYCGDWWMANQMMERSLRWAGYEVNHAWGEGGHNQKHASQIFPEVLRWLWAPEEIRSNGSGMSKWKGGEIFPADSAWQEVPLAALPTQAERTTPFGSASPLPVPGGAAATLSPDQTLLYVAEAGAATIQSMQVGPQSELTHGQRFYRLDTWEGNAPEARSLCVDREGRLYAATDLGVQICDQAGRVNLILPLPEPVSAVGFGGDNGGDLMAICGARCFRRPTLTQGMVSQRMPPSKPAAPKL